jgi:hypothetical protein
LSYRLCASETLRITMVAQHFTPTNDLVPLTYQRVHFTACGGSTCSVAVLKIMRNPQQAEDSYACFDENGSIDAAIEPISTEDIGRYLRLIDWSSHFWLNRKLRSLQSLGERIVHTTAIAQELEPGNVQSTSCRTGRCCLACRAHRDRRSRGSLATLTTASNSEPPSSRAVSTAVAKTHPGPLGTRRGI